MTYHFEFPRTPKDSLYVCLNIPSISPLKNRSLFISKEQTSQLPREIRDTITESTSYFTNPKLDKLEMIDYEFEINNPKTLSTYNASIEEILNFSSKGTEIALRLLNDDRTRKRTWTNDKELVTIINQFVQDSLTTSNERHWGMHFVCNSLCFTREIERYLGSISNQSSDGEGYWALGYLDEIESSGNMLEAWKLFKSIFYQSS